MDRRSKFTPAVRQLIVDGLKAGLPIRHACALAGIDTAQFYRWRTRGETAAEGSTWRQFFLDCEGAQAEMVKGSLAVITQAATDGDWRAAAWKLERRMPEQFGARERPAASSGPVVIELAWPGSPAPALAAASSTVEVLSGEPERGTDPA